MAYCAVGLKTESGDSYTILVDYRNDEEVAEYLYDILDEELGYVFEVSVDSGIDAEKDDKLEEVVWNKIRSLEQE